jgi:predicted ATPase
LGDALGDQARWLAPLVGDLALVERERLSVPAAVARVRMAEVLAEVLESFARPPLVVLDDMHWAYPESLELFGQVARLATGALLVVCSRGSGLELGHPLSQRLAEVQRQRSCEYLSLGSLSREEAGELLERVAGGALEKGLIDAAYEESGGNPFFLGELGRHLYRAGAKSPAGAADRALPESIRAAVGLRLAGLSAQSQHLLGLASVFTAGFGFAELQSLSQLDEGSLLDCLEQALAEELVRPLGGEQYDFAHALVREALYERLSPSRRVRLHRRLAETLDVCTSTSRRRLLGSWCASITRPRRSPGPTGAPRTR